MNKKSSKPSFGRRLGLIALAVGLFSVSTSGASAQTLTAEVSSALASLNHTLAANKQVTLSSTSVTITSTQLESMMLSLSGSDVTNNTPTNIATNITSILQVINAAEGQGDDAGGSIATLGSDTTQLDLLTSAHTALLNNPSYLSANFGKVVGAILAYGNYSSYLTANPPLTEAAIDTAETNIVKQAITDNATDLLDIITQSLLTADPSAIAQGNLVAAEMTTTNLGNASTTGTALGAQVLLTDSNVIGSNAGPFLQELTIKEGTPVLYENFIQGYTASQSPSALETTASNIVANSTSTLSSTMRLNIFTALVLSGSANGETVNTVVSDVAAGLVGGFGYSPTGISSGNVLTSYVNGNDKLKATFVGTLVTNYPSYEAIIAGAGATQLSSLGDVLPYASLVAGNSAITGSNNISGVAAAIANTFVLTSTSSASLDNDDLGYKVEVAQAFVKAHPTDAGVIASAVAQQVLGGTDQNSADQINFATNFIGNLDSIAVATANGVNSTVTDTVRGEMAAALAVAYDGFTGAVPQIALAAAQTDTPGSGNNNATPTNISVIVQPVFNAFLPGGASGLSGNAATVQATAALVSQSFGGLTYDVGGTQVYFTPDVVGAALITGAGTNAGLIGDIALGDATDATINTGYGAGVSGTDTFITKLSTQLKKNPGDLVDIAKALAVNSAFTPQEIAGDVSSANPADAPILASNIVQTYPSITGTQASAVATAAAGVSGATAAEIEMTATDVVMYVPSSLTYVAKSLSGVMVTDFGAGSATTLASDQSALAKDLSLTSTGAGNTVQVAYEVALNAQTDTAIAGIALTVMKLNPTLNSGSAATFAESFIRDFTSLGDPTNDPSFGYSDVATITNSFVGGLSNSTYPGAGTAVTTGLVEQEVTNSALAEPVALAFATALPAASATTVAIAATTEDGTDGYAEAGSIANAIISLVKVGHTKAPTIALAVLAGIPNGSLDTAQAINIAEDATDISGEAEADIVTTATDVVNYVNTNATQPGQAAAALPAIAQSLSAQFVTDFGNVAATLADQEKLAGGLAATPVGQTGTNAVVIAYNVALSGTSDAGIAGIADAALKAVPGDFTGTGANTAATFADNLIADLTVTHPSSFSGFSYTDMAKIGSAFASGISSTVIGSGTAVGTSLVNQELLADGGSVSSAASIGSAFAAAFTSSSLPSIAITFANQATASSLYTSSPLNAEQSGTIGAAIAASLPTATASANAATSGSIAVVAAYAATGPSPSQYNLNNSLQDVAGVFASPLSSGTAVPASDYLSIETDLALQTGANSVRAQNLAIPSIVAAFAPSYATQASLTALLTRLLTNGTGDLNDYVNTPDIFGVLVAYDAAIANTPSLESALISAIDSDVANDLAAYENTPAFHGDTTAAQLKASLNVLLNEAATDAGQGAYGNINANESPIVNL